LLEARSSSEIENIVTTADKLFQYAGAVDDTADPATKEALRYRAALRRGMELLEEKPLVTSTAVGVCRVLLGQDVDIRRVPGTRLLNSLTGEVVYTPPEGEGHLRSLLANWETSLHQAGPDAPDPLIRMAVGHYQFEAIHPFTDGNGRTGRILNLLYLVEQRLLEEPVLYLSRALLRERTEYYRLLLAVTREEAWEGWVLFMLRAVEETAAWTTARIRMIHRLMNETRAFARAHAQGAFSHELLELIFVQPYCRIRNVVDAGIAERETASKYLKAFAAAGILQEVKVGREKLFINPRLVKLLTSDEPGDLSFPATSMLDRRVIPP